MGAWVLTCYFTTKWSGDQTHIGGDSLSELAAGAWLGRQAPGPVPLGSAAASDLTLIKMIAAGHTEALETLYDRYATLAYSLAYRILGDHGASEDAVQEAYLSIWRGAATYHAVRGVPRSWICRVVRNRALDRVRSRRMVATYDVPIESVSLDGGDSETWDSVARMLLHDDMRTALALLPAPQRQALEMAYYLGYSQSEISNATGVPLGTVKSRTRLALLKLRDCVDDGGAVHHAAAL
jgi:RNA polymerase sigma-70 factor (ECF subfamily)